MMKKLLCMMLALFGALISLTAQEEEVPWQKDITMLVVPREKMAVQVAHDISRRYPVLLVCYQRTPAAPLIHAWNGDEWMGIRVTDYTNGTFFTTRPQHAVIVEEDGRPAPDVLVPDGTWCESGNRLSSTDTRVMIHLLGRHFNFPYHYWMQFCRRYGFTIEEINPSLLNVFWWHYRGDRVAPAFEARDFERDMDKWSDLDITQPEPVEPVLIPEETELPPAETPAKELLEEMTTMPSKEPQKEAKETAEKTGDEPLTAGEQTVSEIIIEISNPSAAGKADPFSTNEIPAAVIVAPAE